MGLSKRTGVLSLVLINLGLLAILILTASYFADQRLPKTRAQFISAEDATFYKKYSNQLNHLRSFDFLKQMDPSLLSTRLDYLFSKIGDGKIEVLLQGDSWAEQFMTSRPSVFTLQNFAEVKDVSLIVAGTTSYAPSVMQAQYRILRQDFGISPKIVVGVIDQTDIGDELCRYKDQLAVNQAGEQIVKPFSGPVVVPYHLEKYFRAIDTLDSSDSALLKLLKYKIEKLSPVQAGGCGHEILAPLERTLSPAERNYFLERVARYIDEVFKPLGALPPPTDLILVTHFHKKHLSKEYQTNVAELVAAAVEQSKYRTYITHLNFLPEHYKNENLDTVFVINDSFSHLKDNFHRKIFTRQILHTVEEALLKSSAKPELSSRPALQ